MSGFRLPYLQCKRCLQTWIPRIPRYPKECARCKSPYWNKERQFIRVPLPPVKAAAVKSIRVIEEEWEE